MLPPRPQAVTTGIRRVQMLVLARIVDAGRRRRRPREDGPRRPLLEGCAQSSIHASGSGAHDGRARSRPQGPRRRRRGQRPRHRPGARPSAGSTPRHRRCRTQGDQARRRAAAGPADDASNRPRVHAKDTRESQHRCRNGLTRKAARAGSLGGSGGSSSGASDGPAAENLRPSTPSRSAGRTCPPWRARGCGRPYAIRRRRARATRR